MHWGHQISFSNYKGTLGNQVKFNSVFFKQGIMSGGDFVLAIRSLLLVSLGLKVGFYHSVVFILLLPGTQELFGTR